MDSDGDYCEITGFSYLESPNGPELQVSFVEFMVFRFTHNMNQEMIATPEPQPLDSAARESGVLMDAEQHNEQQDTTPPSEQERAARHEGDDGEDVIFIDKDPPPAGQAEIREERLSDASDLYADAISSDFAQETSSSSSEFEDSYDIGETVDASEIPAEHSVDTHQQQPEMQGDQFYDTESYYNENFEEPEANLQVNGLQNEHEYGQQASNSVHDWHSEEDHNAAGHPVVGTANEQPVNEEDRDSFIPYFDDGGPVYQVNGQSRQRHTDESGASRTSDMAPDWPSRNIHDSDGQDAGNELEPSRDAGEEILHFSDATHVSEAGPNSEVRPRGTEPINSK